ncbi:MAG TPA: M48 family metallopeptidase [Steroidobacteraceae bacterium]|jgi:STE24 endopeptidase|nr:M48 family metallopeptidase [Steroidobacteraceae bacterium]
MAWLTWAFVAAIAAEAVTRLWLGARQVAAVQAHRNLVPEPFQGQVALADQQKAADYTTARIRLGRIATVVEALVKLALTLGGGLAAIDALWRGTALGEPWRGVLVVASVLLLLQLVGLPFSIWRTFRIEARFGFNRMTPRLFLLDLAKELLVSVALGTPLLLAALTLMDRAGRTWWLWVWLIWLAWTLALTWAFPRFIAPLFNKFSPLTDQALKARVETLLERCGFAARGGVFVMDGSQRSSHGNAYFTGIGRNKRIVFFDTLLSRIEPEEIEAVLAHELGHFRLNHVRQRLWMSVLMAFGGLALLAWLAGQPQFYEALGVAIPSSATALLLFMLVIPVFAFFLTPITSWWSRRHERQADDFAAAHADAGKLAAALVKLFRDNASTLTPDRLHSAFFDSHPPALERIGRLSRLVAGAR